MRKNKVDFEVVRNLKTDQAKVAYMMSLFKINDEELVQIRRGSQFDEIFEAARRLLVNSIDKLGFDYNTAITQITYGNLSLLTGIDRRTIGARVGKEYNIFREESRANLIGLLRQEVTQSIREESFFLNVEREEKNPFGINYTDYEQREGIKTIMPEELDEKDFFYLVFIGLMV